MNMTNEDPDGPCAFDDPWTVSHPDHPLIDDDSAVILEDATVELTLLRSPMHLGDGLADLHAMVSLQPQLQAWIPLAVAAAHNQGHTWPEIASQLQISPSTARRRHHAYTTAPPALEFGSPPSHIETGTADD
jgi:Homeodomain-like domain